MCRSAPDEPLAALGALEVAVDVDETPVSGLDPVEVVDTRPDLWTRVRTSVEVSATVSQGTRQTHTQQSHTHNSRTRTHAHTPSTSGLGCVWFFLGWPRLQPCVTGILSLKPGEKEERWKEGRE